MDRRSFLRLTGFAGTAALVGQLPSRLLAGPGRPNILLIITDQQSADVMSCRMGREYLATPAMDGLAARGVTFTRAYAANPLCVPARSSFLTGQYPHVTGVESNDLSRSLAGRFTSLGTYFRDSGYDTAYFGKWHVPLPAKEPAVHGFTTMGAIKNNGIDKEIPGLAISFIRQERERPFLLVASFVNPHNICEWARSEELPDGAVGDPPAAESCPPPVPNPAPMTDETDSMVLMRRSMQANPLFPVGGFDERKWRQYRWTYFRMIERVDGYIGQILASLREADLETSTVVLFVSDHGDMQGMHGWNQKTVFYDNASRVPFILAHPGYPGPRESDRLVNAGIDLLPTLLEIGGVPVPSTLPGLSLIPSVREESPADPRVFVVVESRMVQGAPIDGVKPEANGRMVRSRRYKYCVYDIGEHRESLVDLEADPGETTNLARKEGYAEVLERHRQYLAGFCQSTGDTFPYVK